MIGDGDDPLQSNHINKQVSGLPAKQMLKLTHAPQAHPKINEHQPAQKIPEGFPDVKAN